MIEISSQEAWQIWAPIMALVLILAAGTLWGRRRSASSGPDRAKPMLDALRAANAKVAAVVGAERAVAAAIGALPDDVPPADAERVLRQLTPHYTVRDRYLLMLNAWETQKSPQALASLAGMALADASGGQLELDKALQRALDDGGPVLVDQIAAQLAIRQEELGRYLRTGGTLLQLERAAGRFGASAPDTADRINDAITRIAPYVRARLLKTLLWYIHHWTEEEPREPGPLAEALVPYCLPRFPELSAAVHTAFSRHDGPEWERAHIRFDRTLLDHFSSRGGVAGFNFAAASTRLCEAIMSKDVSTSENAAYEAARLFGDHLYEREQSRLDLQGALDWAEGLHGSLSAYQWLAYELQLPEVRAAEAETISINSRKINAAVKVLADTTATLEPEIALMELRALVLNASVDSLRVALSARWKEDRAVACLSALSGLVLELTAGEPQREGLVGLCLQLPLREGPAPLIDSLLTLLSQRLDKLDGWIETEGSVRELRLAVRRFQTTAPTTAAALSGMLDVVSQRRVIVLEAQIADKLARAAEAEGTTDPFELVLGLYRHYLPGEPRLMLPVRHFIRARHDKVAWRRAGLYLESMALTHFADIGDSAGYDLDYLLQVLSDGLMDHDVEVAWLAAALATKMIEKDLLIRPEDFDTLIAKMDWAANLFDPVPDSFATLRRAIEAALQRRSSRRAGSDGAPH